jgi:hypothetical protein
MRTTAADRLHNTSQHKQQQQQMKKSVRQLVSSSSSSFCSSRIRRASPAGSKKRCVCCCPTAWWCLPACLRPKLCRLATSGNVASSAGRTAPPHPQTGGGTTDREVRGVYFWNTSVGAGGYQMPGKMDPADIMGDSWRVFFLGFSRVRKGGIISLQVRGLRSVST